MNPLMNHLTCHFGGDVSDSKILSPQKEQQWFADNISSNTSHVSMRSELLDHLSKWHKLNADGVVSDSEYEELKKTILSDIKQL